MKNPAAPKTIYLKEYRQPNYWLDEVALRFELDEQATRVYSELKLRRNESVTDNLSLWLDGEELALKSLAIDGRRLTENEYQISENGLTIHSVPEQFLLQVETQVDPQNNRSLEGLYRSSGNFCTQCEAQGFRKISYYPDRPDVMALFTTTIVADKKAYPVLLSNGNLVESGELEGGKHWCRWQDPFPKPSYLFALVAGDLAEIKGSHTTPDGREIALSFFVEHHNRDKCDHAVQSLKKAMLWDEQTFGLVYDLDVYMVVAVDDFNMGAMENKGLNVFNSKYVLANAQTATDQDFQGIEAVIGHEYFHNWTGNRITCRDWFQLSLKEGLTVFRDQEFSADMGSRAVKRIEDVRMLRARQFPEDGGPMAHPIRPEAYMEINNFYTLTIYEKGAEVIRMQHTLLGAAGFRKGMDLYFERFDGQAVTCEDFVAAMADANERDLSQFMRWYSQAGTPRLQVSEHFDAEKKQYRLSFKQFTPATPGQAAEEKLPLHIPLRMGLISDSGEPLSLRLAGETQAQGTERVLEITAAEQEFVFADIESQPHPSLLRGFSAPLILQMQRSDASLALQMAHDSDAFNRWEAGQQFAQGLLLKLVQSIQSGAKLALPESFVTAVAALLCNSASDPAFAAEALTLPSELMLAEQMAVIDVDAIHAAREFMRLALANALNREFETVYHANQTPGDYSPDATSIGKRRLKNVALAYLSCLKTEPVLALAQQQFDTGSNMSDVMAALQVLNGVAGQQREAALAAFYQQWQADRLVMDKWFSLQAMAQLPDTLEQIKTLRQHPDFDLKNPNRVRSLVGAFAMSNPVIFHQKDGEGYRFFADQIIELDRFNPQISARLATALSRWSRYDEARQLLMKVQLKRIAAEDLSKDLFEVINKSLQN